MLIYLGIKLLFWLVLKRLAGYRNTAEKGYSCFGHSQNGRCFWKIEQLCLETASSKVDCLGMSSRRHLPDSVFDRDGLVCLLQSLFHSEVDRVLVWSQSSSLDKIMILLLTNSI